MYQTTEDFTGSDPVYTDGSRDGSSVACATILPSDIVISKRLPDTASTFTAEIWAIIKAMEKLKDSVASKYIIFTDSLSCLQALQYMKQEYPLIGIVIRFLNFYLCFFGILSSRSWEIGSLVSCPHRS